MVRYHDAKPNSRDKIIRYQNHAFKKHQAFLLAIDVLTRSLIRSNSYSEIRPAIPVQEGPQNLHTVCPAAHILPDDLAAHILVLLVLGSHVQNYCQAAMDNPLVHHSAG